MQLTWAKSTSVKTDIKSGASSLDWPKLAVYELFLADLGKKKNTIAVGVWQTKILMQRVQAAFNQNINSIGRNRQSE